MSGTRTKARKKRATRPKSVKRAKTTKTTSKRARTNGANPWFEIRPSSVQGLGAFAIRRIPKGTRVIEYTGDRISHKESDRRYDDESMQRHHTFLFTVDEEIVIDAAVGGNEARFINHSCDPNCEAGVDRRRLYIEAIRPTQPGEELAYDYSYERYDYHSAKDEALYACRCGARTCRGTILAPPSNVTPIS